MKNFGFRNGNNIDHHVAFVAVRTSWIVLILALLTWSIYDVIRQGSLTPPFLLLSVDLAVYFATSLYMRKKLGGRKKE